MKETSVVNGKTYPAKEITFNFVCDLGLYGIGIDDIGTKMMPAARYYMAYCMGTSVEKAGEIIEQHCNNILSADDDENENIYKEILEVSVASRHERPRDIACKRHPVI